MERTSSDWKMYRTRFLVKARRLAEAYSFLDHMGREQKGGAGDYLVESSDGTRRIAPRHVFEDIYVPLEPAQEWAQPVEGKELDEFSASASGGLGRTA